MEVDIRSLIKQLVDFKKRKRLSWDDDFMLSVVIGVLEAVAEKDKKGEQK